MRRWKGRSYLGTAMLGNVKPMWTSCARICSEISVVFSCLTIYDHMSSCFL